DIGRAKHHVHLLFYIVFDDEIGQRVGDALAEAVRRGVKCRLMVDAVGSWRAFNRLVPELRAAGVEVVNMLPVHPFRRKLARLDLRNRRKIAVIDGMVAYTGSQNIVDANYGHKDLTWHDMMLRLT